MANVPADLSELFDRCRQDHRAWINGDASGYALPADGTIMGAVGGSGYGGAETADRQAAVASQWRSGHGDLEFLNGGSTAGLAWIAFIERATVRFAGEDQERRWDLRVTEVFRRVDAGWERVHRHADPLVDRRPVAEVASLLEEPLMRGHISSMSETGGPRSGDPERLPSCDTGLIPPSVSVGPADDPHRQSQEGG